RAHSPRAGPSAERDRRRCSVITPATSTRRSSPSPASHRSATGGSKTGRHTEPVHLAGPWPLTPHLPIFATMPRSFYRRPGAVFLLLSWAQVATANALPCGIACLLEIDTAHHHHAAAYEDHAIGHHIRGPQVS